MPLPRIPPAPVKQQPQRPDLAGGVELLAHREDGRDVFGLGGWNQRQDPGGVEPVAQLEKTLVGQFTAMETAMSRIKTQGGALTSFLGQQESSG